MPVEFAAHVRDRVTALVREILDREGLAVAVEPGASLADLGLASMDMVNLMLGVEAEFDFTIPPADITPETFRSVESIERMVVRHVPVRIAA